MLGTHPHKNTDIKLTIYLTKLKTYQSLLFCPAYLFSLEDLKRRWSIVTFFSKLYVEYHLCLDVRALNTCITRGPETLTEQG